MKRAAIVVVALLAGGVLFRVYEGSGPVKAYEAFAEEILHRRYDAAARMTDGLTAGRLSDLGSQERIGGGPPMFQKLFPSRFRIESKETKDGTATIVAVQTVLFNPAGVESAIRPAMYAELRQVTTLHKTSGGWKVTEFRNDFVKMDEVAHR
jgi:hypothetical protein